MADGGGLRKPGPLSFTADGWRTFEMEFDVYIEAMYGEKSEKAKAMMFLNLAGREAIEREKSFTYREEVKEEDVVVSAAESRYDLETLKSKFREICEPKKNLIMERHAFNSRFQRKKGEKDKNGDILDKDEDTQKFISDLRILARTCEFGNLTDEFIRDRIVCGIINDNIRFMLLKKSKLTLDSAIELCMLNEQSKQHNEKFMKKEQERQEINAVRDQPPRQKRETRQKRYDDKKSKCDKCGYVHRGQYCPAKNKQCDRCKEWGHFISRCPEKQNQRHRVHEVAENDSDNQEEYIVESIGVNRRAGEAFATVRVNNQDSEMKLDTGARCSVMSRATFESLRSDEQINPSEAVKLVAFGGDSFSSLGTVKLVCSVNNQTHELTFQVVDRHVKTLLGLKDLILLDLIKLDSKVVHEVNASQTLLEEYSDLLSEDIGIFTGNIQNEVGS